MSKNRGDEHAAESKLKWLAQAAVLSAGWRLAGPVRLPLGHPGDLPHGLEASLECPRSLGVSRNSSTRGSGSAAGAVAVAPG